MAKLRTGTIGVPRTPKKMAVSVTPILLPPSVKPQAIGVDDPQEIGSTRQDDVVLIHAEKPRGFPALIDGAHGENKPGEGIKGEKSPFIAGAHICARKIAKYPEQREGDVADDRGPGDARDQTQPQGKRREGHQPVSIFDPKHFVE